MTNIYLISAGIVFMYFIIKLLEMKYVNKENTSMKLLIRDCLIVYVSCIVIFMIINHLFPMLQDKNIIPIAFTDNPEF